MRIDKVSRAFETFLSVSSRPRPNPQLPSRAAPRTRGLHVLPQTRLPSFSCFLYIFVYFMNSGIVLLMFQHPGRHPLLLLLLLLL